MQGFQDGANRPYLHLVDGGVSDNLGMRGVLEALETLEASAGYRRKGKIDSVRRMVVFVVNSLSQPKTNWDRGERPPSDVVILLKATGVPIDRYSYEAVELLKDLIVRWQTLRALKSAGAFANGGNPALARAADVPDIELYPIDVSFAVHPDADERAYLNEMPTSFVLSAEQVDRLRAAAGLAIRESPEFGRLLRDMHATVLPASAVPAPPVSAVR